MSKKYYLREGIYDRIPLYKQLPKDIDKRWEFNFIIRLSNPNLKEVIKIEAKANKSNKKVPK